MLLESVLTAPGKGVSGRFRLWADGRQCLDQMLELFFLLMLSACDLQGFKSGFLNEFEPRQKLFCHSGQKYYGHCKGRRLCD